jgi:hypothetical protein
MSASPRRPAPAAIVGAGAASAFGAGWRGLGRALRDGALRFHPSAQLAETHPGTLASEVAPPGAGEDPSDPRARKLMSRAAHLAAMALARALADAGFGGGREGIGYFLGLGASGGPIDELHAILGASAVDRRLDLARFARDGLPATSPLLAFHLLNNLVLCHGAIAEGLGGPNAAFYSRGSGTFLALEEALWALDGGACERAVAGGADSALHLGTLVELLLGGGVAAGLVPGEGAALLALSRGGGPALASLDACAVRRGGALGEAVEAVWTALAPGRIDWLVVAPWGPPARSALQAFARDRLPGTPVVDASAGLGDPLAAAPALACAAALDLLVGGGGRALVLGAGLDGAAGGAILSAGGSA